MAVLDEALSDAVAPTGAYAINWLENIRDRISPFFWRWYHDHKNDKITSIKVLLFSVPVKVHHVKPLFEILFGKES